MSLSCTISVRGIVHLDKTDKNAETLKKLQICRLCDELGVKPPEELIQLWYSVEFTDKGDVTIDLPEESITQCYNRYIEVDLEKLPKEITKLRFEHY